MGVPIRNKEKLEAFLAIVGKINKIIQKTRIPQLLKVREARGGCWATEKSQDKSEQFKKKNCQRERTGQNTKLDALNGGSRELQSSVDGR